VDRALELREHVVAHLVAAGAELSVLVSSIAVLKAPQNRMPPMKPPRVRKPRLRCTLGRRMMVQ
jgi:hypothetical protein